MTCDDVVVTVESPPEIVLEVTKETVLPVVEVQIAGIQGTGAGDKPLDIDPLEIYLKARGELINAYDS